MDTSKEVIATDQSVDHIDTLDVSDSWKKTFKIIEKAEPTGLLQFKKADQLSFSERNKMIRNFKAFFFSGFYYLAKKMYKKGLVIFGATCIYVTLLMIIERAFSFTFPDVIYYIPASGVSSMFANYDYYQKMVNNKQMWQHMGVFNQMYACVIFAVGVLVLFICTI